MNGSQRIVETRDSGIACEGLTTSFHRCYLHTRSPYDGDWPTGDRRWAPKRRLTLARLEPESRAQSHMGNGRWARLLVRCIIGPSTLLEPVSEIGRLYRELPLRQHVARHRDEWPTGRLEDEGAIRQPLFIDLWIGILPHRLLQNRALEIQSDCIRCGVPLAAAPPSLRRLEGGEQLATDLGGTHVRSPRDPERSHWSGADDNPG